jgi:ABC-2 type transport system ATP-binding protein
VDRVTFGVAEGEIVGLLGPNGAGKSTTMKMLTCYLPPTSGAGKVAGFDVFDQPDEVRANLGYLPENCPLYHDMKVREYLDFRGRLRKLGRAERKSRAAEVMERCFLAPMSNRLIGHLSKGYRQRVGLADALLHDPKVLILDEPTVGLDPTQIRETRKLIKSLAGRHTVMLSTHILPEVEAVCSRVIVIAGGRVVAEGTPDELRRSKTNRMMVQFRASGVDPSVPRPILQRLPGVKSVRLAGREGDGGGVLTFVIEHEPGTDPREQLAHAIIGQGWSLRELRFDTVTLEEFFVRVTAEQAVSGGVEGGEVLA